MSRKFLVSFSIFLCFIINCTAYEVVNSTQIKIEQQSGLKNYEEEEDGKVLPYRTFLTTVEIVLICVFTVLFVIFMSLLTIYLCMYGCVLPACCRRTSKDYTQVQLQRERKISEIWKTNYRQQP